MAFKQDDVALIRAWAKDAEKFVTEALGVKSVSDQQKQLYAAMTAMVWAKINRGEGRKQTAEEEALAKKIGISIQSGKGTGKTVAAAQMILWFLICFPESLIVCTAPTAHQLRDNVWQALSRLKNGMDGVTPIIKDWITVQSDKVFFNDPVKGYDGKSWMCIARTAPRNGSEAELAATLSGKHNRYMLMIADEAAAVPDPVFKDLESTLTEQCNLALLLFNPSRDTGFAIETHRKAADRWVHHRWSSLDSPWVLKDQVERMRQQYGVDSNLYRVTVLGLPPLVSNDTLIPYSWADEAINAEIESMPGDIEIAGIDVGAGGDPSIYLQRRGPIITLIKQIDTPDPEVLTGKLLALMWEHNPRYVFVDKIGVGWGIVGNLKSRVRNPQISIIGVNVGEVASNDNRFHRKRDELCWRVREEFAQHAIKIPEDQLLINELTNIKYEEPDGRVVIESKKKMKSRGMESPNRFDALALTEYYQHDMLRHINTEKVVPLWKQRRATTSWKTV